MNNNAKKWVEALRSGEFQQTKGKLHNGSEYCCLGVACAIYAEEGGGNFEKDAVYDEWSFDGECSTLPDSVLDWLNLQTDAGYFKLIDGDGSLLDANDEQGKTFEEIADIIDSEPEGLFVKEVC